MSANPAAKADKRVYTNNYYQTPFQLWVIEPAGNGYSVLRNEATGLVLDSNANRQVYTNDANGGLYQCWAVSAV